MCDEKSSQSSSDKNNDDEKVTENPRKTAEERVWVTATDLDESKGEQEGLFTGHVRNRPYNAEANDRVGTGGLADPINKERPSDEGINGHDLQTREEPSAHTAPNQAQQLYMDHVNESKVVNNAQAWGHSFWKKWACISIRFVGKYAHTRRIFVNFEETNLKQHRLSPPLHAQILLCNQVLHLERKRYRKRFVSL